jgi:hypothetical protein
MSDFVTISVPAKFSRQIGYALECLELGGTVHLAGLPQFKKPSLRSCGSRNSSARLTETDIPVIRQKIAQGISISAIAARYKVSRKTITNVRDGHTWSHVAS